jgi:hypothetical protein
MSVTVNITKGDTVLIFIMEQSANRTFTIADPAGNSYTRLGAIMFGSPYLQVYSTAAGGAKASSGTMTMTNSGAAERSAALVVDAYNVGSITQYDLTASGTSVTPALTNGTLDNNNLFVTEMLWYYASGNTTVSANQGTLQSSFGGTAATYGGALVTNTSATPASVTDSVTISQSTGWNALGVELRSVQLNVPTVDLPPVLIQS